jgi:hypothetical protein
VECADRLSRQWLPEKWIFGQAKWDRKPGACVVLFRRMKPIAPGLRTIQDEEGPSTCLRQRRRAASMAATSIFFIVIIASKTRFASSPPAASASVSAIGVIFSRLLSTKM